MDYINTNDLRNKITSFERSRNLYVLGDYKALYETNKKRSIVDISTDAFIYVFFSNEGNDENDKAWKKYNRGLFLSYIYYYFDLNLDTLLNKELINNNIKPLYKFSSNDNIMNDCENNNEFVIFLFKGGNIMNMYLKKYFNSNTFDFSNLDDNIKKAFKISDFDFTVYLKCKTDERFNIINKYLQKVIYDILSKINLFFNKYINIVFKQYVPQNNNEKNKLKKNYIITISPTSSHHIKSINILLKDIESSLTKIYNFNPFIKSLQIISIKKILINIIQNKKNINNLTPNEIRKIYNIIPFISEEIDEEKNVKYLLFKQFIKFLTLLTSVYKNIITINNIQRYIMNNDVLKKKYPRYYYIYNKIRNCNNLINNINKKSNYNILKTINIIKDNPIYNFLKIFENVFIEHNFYSINKFTELKNKLKTELLNFSNNNLGKYFYEKPKKKKLFGIYGIPDSVSGYMSRNSDNLIGYNLDSINVNNSIDIDFMNSSRDNNVLNIGININNLYSKYNYKNIHYLTINNTIYNSLSEKLSEISFNLIRTKINIILKNVKVKKYNDMPTLIPMNIPSEFIDISIPLLNDSFYVHYIKHPKKYTSKIDIDYGYGNNLIKGELNKLRTYNIKYIISDLHDVLFRQKFYIPWFDIKYGKRMKRLFIMYILESEEIPNNYIYNKNIYKKKKINEKIIRLLQVLDIIEKINTHIIQANNNNNNNSTNYKITMNSPIYVYSNYTTEEFDKLITHSLITEDNIVYNKFINNKLLDYLLPNILNILMFFILILCYANVNDKNKINIEKYINFLNKQYLYIPFDNFKSEYLDKIYDLTQLNNYGKGFIYEIKNSLICSLKTFYNLREYKDSIRNIILTYINPITGKRFNQIYNLNSNNDIDNWINNQSCI